MIRELLKKIVRFKRSEDGSLTVEFVLIFPAYLFFIMGAVEYSMVTIQQSLLERSMDIVVRDIRLGTDAVITHDTIKDDICSRAGIIPSCSKNLRLEMILQDAFTGLDFPVEPDCVNREEEAKPARNFEAGASNALMILRACAKVDPIFPTTAMGRALQSDDGLVTLTSITAFVQEP
ncbi:TadE/TadG family type IV pilus assembly protein [Ruegeria arenilitoris]|uniref:TadE/TadG family type IV pilus assembly protein n=1 Tax=Ruegeria arenilitoris TaxID=1173585 RepID=UPI00147D053B|nr:TadE family protein [Ruegeria arenilitoris]